MFGKKVQCGCKCCRWQLPCLIWTVIIVLGVSNISWNNLINISCPTMQTHICCTDVSKKLWNELLCHLYHLLVAMVTLYFYPYFSSSDTSLFASYTPSVIKKKVSKRLTFSLSDTFLSGTITFCKRKVRAFLYLCHSW